MLFFLSRELWQTVRHCTRNPVAQTDIWYWTTEGGRDDVLLRSHNERRTLASVIAGVRETARDPTAIVAAAADLSDGFKQVILRLTSHPADLRICVLLTSRLDKSQVEECRNFFRAHPHLQNRISTFFFSTRFDTEMVPLDSSLVSEDYRSFLRLLCVGRESLANSLGLFRVPLADDVLELEDVPLEEGASFRMSGFLAALGVRSWLPRREEIVRLTENLLSTYVIAEEKRALACNQIRTVDPEALITAALYLGMAEEPLNVRHFAGMIPPPPDTPFESWKIPLSMKRARKQTHYLQRRLQEDFAEYTRALEATLDEISGRIRRQSAVCFAEASKAYRSDMLKDANLGTLSYLVREYYPTFASYDEPLLADLEEESTGWPPDESLDLFCGVYEALDDGLDKLPSSKTWAVSAYVAVAFFLAAGVFWSPEGWLPLAMSIVGLVAPAGVWIYRFFGVRALRRRLVQIADTVFASLRENFESEIQWILRQTRVRLEREIRLDALGLGDHLRQEFEAIPFVFTAPDMERDETQKEIREIRLGLIKIGVEEMKLDPLPGRLDGLAKKIIERVTREDEADEVSSEPSPKEMVEEWVDELVGSSSLPLEKVAALREEILQVATTWRTPAFMAPLTDAELHRGFRKVVILPDTDIAYQRLYESLPKSSGNPVVTLKGWLGPAPGIAVCSVLNGLPQSILDHQIKAPDDSVAPTTERSLGIH